MKKWILSDNYECILINAIPVLELSFNKTEENKKIIKIASKANEMLELLEECNETFNCNDSSDRLLKQRIIDLMKDLK